MRGGARRTSRGGALGGGGRGRPPPHARRARSPRKILDAQINDGPTPGRGTRPTMRRCRVGGGRQSVGPVTTPGGSWKSSLKERVLLVTGLRVAAGPSRGGARRTSRGGALGRGGRGRPPPHARRVRSPGKILDAQINDGPTPGRGTRPTMRRCRVGGGRQSVGPVTTPGGSWESSLKERVLLATGLRVAAGPKRGGARRTSRGGALGRGG